MRHIIPISGKDSLTTALVVMNDTHTHTHTAKTRPRIHLQ